MEAPGRKYEAESSSTSMFVAFGVDIMASVRRAGMVRTLNVGQKTGTVAVDSNV